jgi:pilus assembly protein Flp/PilA
MFSSAKQPIIGALLHRFLNDENGATAIEYAMIASGIAVAIAATIVNLGSSVKGLYTSVATAMN